MNSFHAFKVGVQKLFARSRVGHEIFCHHKTFEPATSYFLTIPILNSMLILLWKIYVGEELVTLFGTTGVDRTL